MSDYKHIEQKHRNLKEFFNTLISKLFFFLLYSHLKCADVCSFLSYESLMLLLKYCFSHDIFSHNTCADTPDIDVSPW